MRSPLARHPSPLTRPSLRSFTQVIPRADGLFVPGTHKFKVACNLWALNGYDGSLEAIAGAPNQTMRKPLAEYLKNILRGRKHHGLGCRLTRKWAELPPGQTELPPEVAFPARAVEKRARPGPALEGGSLPRMMPM